MSYAGGTPVTLPLTLEDGVDSPLAAHQNEANAEVNDIITVLGTASDIKSGAASAAARLATFLDGRYIKSGGGVSGAVRNLKITRASANTLSVSWDEVIFKRSTGGRATSENQSRTLDISASGVNGLDTGSEAATTIYYVWIIWNQVGAQTLLSLSSTAPTMPSGFTFKALVGAWRNNASSDLAAGRLLGKDFFYDAAGSILSNGTATSETAVSLSSAAWVPPEAHSIYLSAQLGVGSTTDDDEGTATIRVVSGSDFIILRQRAKSSTGTQRNYVNSYLKVPNVGQQVYYLVGGAAVTKELSLEVKGFQFK